MKLSSEDTALFFKLFQALLFYVNSRLGIIDKALSKEKFLALSIKERSKIRDALYERIDLIDAFRKENPFDLSESELKIIAGWKNYVKSTFYIVKYLKKYAVFLNSGTPRKAYGVLALFDTFDEMLGSNLPIMVDTVLLPFKEQIIYDGMITPYSIIFGAGMRRDINDAYQEAKASYGIITSLPFSAKQQPEQSDAERLKFYLKNERNREYYEDEITRLIRSDPDLLILFHQEMGKIKARRYGRYLRDIGLADAWFAILEGIVIAGGKTKTDVERTVQDIVPAGKKDFVYIFRLKG